MPAMLKYSGFAILTIVLLFLFAPVVDHYRLSRWHFTQELKLLRETYPSSGIIVPVDSIPRFVAIIDTTSSSSGSVGIARSAVLSDAPCYIVVEGLPSAVGLEEPTWPLLVTIIDDVRIQKQLDDDTVDRVAKILASRLTRRLYPRTYFLLHFLTF